MSLNQKQRKWRRINPYICSECGKPRYSFVFTRAKEKICRNCAKNKVPENQQSLFNVASDLKDFAGGLATNIKTDLDHEEMPAGLKENLKLAAKIKVAPKMDTNEKAAQKIMDNYLNKKAKNLAERIDRGLPLDKKIVIKRNKQAMERGDYETKEIIDAAFPPLGRKKK